MKNDKLNSHTTKICKRCKITFNHNTNRCIKCKSWTALFSFAYYAHNKPVDFNDYVHIGE